MREKASALEHAEGEARHNVFLIGLCEDKIVQKAVATLLGLVYEPLP